VGLFLAATPNQGGVYQYSLSIIKALRALDQNVYKVRCFYLTPDWSSFIPNEFEKNLVKQKTLNRILGFLIHKFINTTSGWRFLGRFADGSAEINSSDCDVVIYPAQDRLAYQTNKKSISTIHDLMHRYESHFDEYKGAECANRDVHYSAICKYSELILVDSLIGREHVYESYLVDRNKIKVLPFVPPSYLLNSNFVNVKSKFSLPDKFIFYPAQYWEHKNHINLLNAIKHLKDHGIHVNLVLVGSQKNNYIATMDRISELDLSSNVFVLGYVSNDEMYSLYKTAIAMIFVSLIGPTNIPPMEALVAGCPLVCSNSYAMPEQVGDAALFVDPKNSFDIAEKINLVWNNEDIRKKLIQLGFQQISKYNQVDFSRLLNEYLDEVFVRLKNIKSR
jgi:glycosyltransferase involved in cell wall biosynthesis